MRNFFLAFSSRKSTQNKSLTFSATNNSDAPKDTIKEFIMQTGANLTVANQNIFLYLIYACNIYDSFSCIFFVSVVYDCPNRPVVCSNKEHICRTQCDKSLIGGKIFRKFFSCCCCVQIDFRNCY